MRYLPPQVPAAVLAMALLAGSALAQEPAAPGRIVEVAPASAPGPKSGTPRRIVAPALPPGTPEEIDGAEAASRPVTTLSAALERAYWTNPKLLSERARMRGTDYRVPQARSQYGPRLDFQASYGYQRDNFEQPAGGFFARSGWTSVASAILTQPVYTFGRNAAAERTAMAQVAYERAVLRYTEQQTMFDAISAYAQVLRDRAGVGIAADNLALLERELADTETRFKARETTATDLEQVRTRVELGRAQLFSAQRLAATSDARFLSVVGAPAGVLGQPNPLALPVATLEQAYALAETHDPLIAAAYARERISRAQRDAAKADLLPRVDIRGRADYGTVTPYTDNLRETQLSAQVVISGPIFESGLRRARLGEAEANNEADWRLIDSAVREQRVEVADAWNEWLSQSASIARLKASVTSAEAAYDGAVLQERAGLRTTLDVLDLARELLTSRSAYNNASAQAYVAQARLLAALGSLGHDNLLPDAAQYDAEKHFERVNNKGDVPLFTPLMRTIDSALSGSSRNRPLRDPAASLGVAGVALPVPDAPAEPAK